MVGLQRTPCQAPARGPDPRCRPRQAHQRKRSRRRCLLHQKWRRGSSQPGRDSVKILPDVCTSSDVASAYRASITSTGKRPTPRLQQRPLQKHAVSAFLMDIHITMGFRPRLSRAPLRSACRWKSPMKTFHRVRVAVSMLGYKRMESIGSSDKSKPPTKTQPASTAGNCDKRHR